MADPQQIPAPPPGYMIDPSDPTRAIPVAAPQSVFGDRPIIREGPKPVDPLDLKMKQLDIAKKEADLQPTTEGELDDKTLDFYAQQVLTGAPMPAMGMGKAAATARQKIMGRVAQIAGAEGLSGNEMAAQIAHYKAGTGALQKMQTMHDQIRSAEETALANGRQFLQTSQNLPLQTETPALNSIIQFGQRNIGAVPGHEQIAAADVAYQTFVNEYAKVVAGSPSGAGVLSDSARKEAQDVLRSNAGPAQKKAALAQMEKDMQNRMDAINAVISDGYKNISQRYDKFNVPDDPSQAQLPADWIKNHPDTIAAKTLGIAGPGNGGGTDGGGGDTPPGLSDLTPDQQAKDREFLATKPSAEQYTAFLSTLLGKPADPEQSKKRLAAALAGGTYSGAVDNSAAIKQRIADENKLGVGETPTDTLARQGATLNLSDEAAGVGNAAANVLTSPFTGKFDPVGSYTFGRDVERQRIADARQQLGYGGTGIELASSLGSLNPAGAVEALAPKAATAVGALAGFGGGDGAAQSTTGAGVGALGGYAIGRYAEPVLSAASRAVGKAITNGLRARLLPPQGMAPDVAAAAQAENVSLIRPMVDPASRAKYGTLESSPASQSTIRAGFGRVLGQIEDRVKSLGGAGTPLAETDQVGSAAQAGGRSWLAGRTSLKNRLYQKAEEAGAGARFVPQDALNEADSIIADLSGNKNANAAEINFLKGYREDLAAPGGKTVAEIRNLREGLRQSIDQNRLTMDGAGVRALRVLNAAKGDIAKNVPDAAAAYNRADQYYASSQQVVDDLQKSILGTTAKPIDPQVAAKNLRAMVSDKSTGRRFSRIMDSLDSDTRQDVAATWANALGRAAPDMPFELGKFLKQTESFSPGALRTTFGPEAAQSVQNLRTLSKALQDSGKDVNYSRSGTNIIRYLARNFLTGVTGLGTTGAIMSHSVEGAGVGAAAGLAAGAAGGVRDILSARAMVNPRVSQWLADAATVTNRTQAHASLRKLSVIIGREPALASELTPLYNQISSALSQPMALPLAAQPSQPNQQQPAQ